LLVLMLVIEISIVIINVLLDKPFFGSFADIDEAFPTLRFMLRLRIAMSQSVVMVGSTMIVMGCSLLPLSVLLLALPAHNPAEAVLADSVPPTRSIFRNLFRRIGAVLTASVLLFALLAFATELVTLLHLSSDTFYGTIVRKLLPDGLISRLPFSLV